MPNDQLHALLRALSAEIARTPDPDPESGRLLALVVAEFERRGGRAGPALTSGGFESLAVRFEADHPAVAAALRQAADLLGKAGI